MHPPSAGPIPFPKVPTPPSRPPAAPHGPAGAPPGPSPPPPGLPPGARGRAGTAAKMAAPLAGQAGAVLRDLALLSARLRARFPVSERARPHAPPSPLVVPA